MRLYEYEGYRLLQSEGIPVPSNGLAATPEEALVKASAIGLPVVIKAQVLTGGRWLAGGVQNAQSLEEVGEYTRRMLGGNIAGLPVQQVMVSQKLDIVREFYLGITVDDYRGIPLAIISVSGGVAVNQLVKERPESMSTRPLSINEGLSVAVAEQMCQEVGLRGSEQSQVAMLLAALFRVFRWNDALVAEINPLVKTADGSFVAVDAKVEIDDASLFRHTDLQIKPLERLVNPLERRGRELGVSYVELDGDIAVIASGAGLGMASVDVICQKLRPANFLETGGAITEDLLYKATELVLQKKGVRALYISLYGGINPIHEGAKGVIHYLQEHHITVPVVAKALGNHQEETWQIFRAAGVHVVTEVSTEKAVAVLAGLLEAK